MRSLIPLAFSPEIVLPKSPLGPTSSRRLVSRSSGESRDLPRIGFVSPKRHPVASNAPHRGWIVDFIAISIISSFRQNAGADRAGW
jgi:hypothetical protein